MGTMELKNIKKNYDGVEVLHDINFDIKDGEFVVLIGESGCGKSTLLRMICGLEDISSGELIIDGKLANEITPQKRDMSMVFQSYALYPHMSVYDNIAYGLKMQKISKNIIKQKIENVTKLLGIDSYLDRLPKNLSGGQRQRVAMGRAIVREPSFFLFDEPLSNLDAKLRVVMRNEIKSLQKKLKTTTIYVTHDQIEAMTMADKIVLLDAGHVVQVGTPHDLYDRPNSIFSASFLGNPQISLINGTVLLEKNRAFLITEDDIKFPIRFFESLKDKQEIILGIRPREFHISKTKTDFFVGVNVHEYTGAENVIYGHIGINEVSISFSRKEKFQAKEDLHVTYDIEKIHLFDAKTQKIIDK